MANEFIVSERKDHTHLPDSLPPTDGLARYNFFSDRTGFGEIFQGPPVVGGYATGAADVYVVLQSEAGHQITIPIYDRSITGDHFASPETVGAILEDLFDDPDILPNAA